MIAVLHFVSQTKQEGQAVFITSWVELAAIASLLTILGAFATAYRHIECHQDGCHRLGRFPHGHLRLCHVHHPLVPADGRITAEHINAIQPKEQHASL
jgi:hypothetical protein